VSWHKAKFSTGHRGTAEEVGDALAVEVDDRQTGG
jgi:hypothetical protein